MTQSTFYIYKHIDGIIQYLVGSGTRDEVKQYAGIDSFNGKNHKDETYAKAIHTNKNITILKR